MEVGVGLGTIVTLISQEGAGVLVCVGVLVGVGVEVSYRDWETDRKSVV